MRLNIQGTLLENELLFAGGNPGALNALAAIRNEVGIEDFALYLMKLDFMELYEDKLYMLWNDSCDRNVKKVIKVMEAFEIGLISKQDIDDRIRNVGRGKSFDDLLETKEKLPRCSICGKNYTGYGNNALPVNKGRCCDVCNKSIVVPRRIRDAEARREHPYA